MRARLVLWLWFVCIGALLCASPPAFAGPVTGLTPFTPGTPALAGEVNANFGIVAAAVNDNHTRLTAAEGDITALETGLGGKQDRVTGTCDTGSAISAVAADGSVSCTPLAADSTLAVAYSGFIRASYGTSAECAAGFSASAHYYTGSDTVTGCISLAPLTLPHGVTLQSLSCRVNDSYAEGDIHVLLRRLSLTSSATNTVFQTPRSADGGGQSIVDASANNGAVDNTAFAYDLMVFFENDEADPFSVVASNLSLTGCSVAFSAPE